MSSKFKKVNWYTKTVEAFKLPYLKILVSFLIVIFIGAFLLSLPIASQGKPIDFVDALFTSFSSVCVTGLNALPQSFADSYSLFGKIVIAFLMEIGGLSFLTIALFFFIILGVKLGLEERFMMKEVLNVNNIKGVFKLVKIVVITSLIIQLFGAILNFIALYHTYPFWENIGFSIFHAISSFANVGIDVFGDSSLKPFENNVLLNTSTCLLVILGGLGIMVLHDIFKKRKFQKLTLMSKIVLIMSVLLTLISFILIKFSADINSGKALFYSINLRTAGFINEDLHNQTPSAYIITLMMMFIGGAPNSTAGGVKVTTIFIIVMALFSRGHGFNIFYRRISERTVYKAFLVVFLSLFYILVVTLLIAFSEPQLAPGDIFFEVTSAFSTAGYENGVTQQLNCFSKLMICGTMLLGRLGPLLIAQVIHKNWGAEQDAKYIEENVVVG